MFKDRNGSSLDDHGLNTGYAHITAVKVLTGDDDYHITDSLTVRSIENLEKGDPVLPPHQKAFELKVVKDTRTRACKARLRGEIAVVIDCMGEDGRAFNLVVYHHKGEVFLEHNEVMDF